jgi:hypothetical protein
MRFAMGQWCKPRLQRVPIEPLLALVQDPPQRSAEDIRLCVFGHAARVQHALITLDGAIELLQLSTENIRPEYDLLEGTRLRFRCVRTRHARPPEYGFEECGIFLLLDQRRSGQIEKQVRVPPGNFPGPGIIGIAQVRADDSDRGIAARNVVEQRHSQAVHADILGDFGPRAVHNPGVEQKHHAMLGGAIVDWRVAGIIERLSRTADLTQAAETGLMKAINLLKHVGIV